MIDNKAEQQVERDTRQVILPAMVTLYVSRALEASSASPEAAIESYDASKWVNNNDITDLNCCPPLTSAGLVYEQATRKLEDHRLLREILTPAQLIHSNRADSHLVLDFTASYPTIALGYLYEAINSGDRPKPETADEMLGLLSTKDFNKALWQGMIGASGEWRQSASTQPWDIFSSFRTLYDYESGESPFDYNETGEASLKMPIVNHLRQAMKRRNQAGKLNVAGPDVRRAAVGCPVTITTIRNISKDPYSPRYLSKEQITELTATRDDGEALATEDESGIIRIKFDVVGALQRYFTDYMASYFDKYKAPVVRGVSEDRREYHNFKGVAIGDVSIGHIEPAVRMPQATNMTEMTRPFANVNA